MCTATEVTGCVQPAWAVQSAAGGRRFANLNFRGRRLWSPAESDTLNATDPEHQLGDGDSESATTEQHAPGCDYDRKQGARKPPPGPLAATLAPQASWPHPRAAPPKGTHTNEGPASETEPPPGPRARSALWLEPH